MKVPWADYLYVPKLQIANAFDNSTDARRTLREIKLLRRLQHENIVLLKDIMLSLIHI